jgi:glycerophosphoryl diester phosphodiesterase
MTDLKRSMIFAHRGANREAAENTRSAFERALSYLIDGMETDIQLSRDGVPVLWHDRQLSKLGLASKHIDDYDYRELQAMNFASHFGSDAKKEGVMGLGDFLQSYRDRWRSRTGSGKNPAATNSRSG